MKAAVVIDSWKEDTFRDVLSDYGYTFEVFPFTDESKLVQVQAPDGGLAELYLVIQKAHDKCKELKN